MRTLSLTCSARRLVGGLVCGGLLIFTRLLPAQDDKPILRGGNPPALVKRVARREALKYQRYYRATEGPDYLRDPSLLSSQRTVNYRQPSQPAWLLTTSIGGKHDTYSQVVLVSARDGRVIFESPRPTKGVDGAEDDSAAGGANEACMVQISPGRYALVVVADGGRDSGSVEVLALGGPRPIHALFSVPADPQGDQPEQKTHSNVYFVQVQPNEPFAIALRQIVADDPDDDPLKPVRHDSLFKLDAKADCYVATPFPPEQLTRLIDSARRNPDTFKFAQWGGLGFEGKLDDAFGVTAARNALNEVRGQVRQSLPPDKAAAFQKQEDQWDDHTDDDWDEEKNRLVERTKDLQKRFGLKAAETTPASD